MMILREQIMFISEIAAYDVTMLFVNILNIDSLLVTVVA